ncbi:hypothetical protein LCGC14_1898240 [marine sediment metagenome]|uniref:HTH arsR-type domain-containing protein n=1 Tax=marine sediment metagenome TaxID=412755 RepID=A0A0F9IB84_9ZZZZ
MLHGVKERVGLKVTNSEKIPKIKRIMELLADKEMTSVELAPILKITVANCSYKLNILMNDGRIIRTNNKKPYKYKVAITPKELLKFYNNFFKDNVDYLMKKPKIRDYILNHDEFDKAEDVIKKCQV